MCVISEKCWKSHPGWRGHRDGQWGFPAAGGFICDTQYNLGGKTWRGVIMMKDMLRIFFTSEIELSGIWITTLLRNEVGSGWGRTVRKLYTNGNNFASNFLALPTSTTGPTWFRWRVAINIPESSIRFISLVEKALRHSIGFYLYNFFESFRVIQYFSCQKQC